MAGRPLAVHELEAVRVDGGLTARQYINQTEQTIARRMREMARLGILSSKTREGKNFREFDKGPLFGLAFEIGS